MSEARTPKTPGPTAERVVFDGNWKDAVRSALGRGKPPAKTTAKKKKRRSK